MTSPGHRNACGEIISLDLQAPKRTAFGIPMNDMMRMLEGSASNVVVHVLDLVMTVTVMMIHIQMILRRRKVVLVG